MVGGCLSPHLHSLSKLCLQSYVCTNQMRFDYITEYDKFIRNGHTIKSN